MSDKFNPIFEQEEDQPPVLGSWNRFYLLVVVLHSIIIALFYWLTMAYA